MRSDDQFTPVRQDMVAKLRKFAALNWGIDPALFYSAALSSKPWVIISDGATGYSPEKQASQY